MSLNKTYIIAEIGTSHGGNLDKALKLIEGAKNAGADCAKFQVVFANEIIHKNTGIVQLPTGDIPLYNVFKSLEMELDFYRDLKNICTEYEIDFLASPFGIKSARILRDLDSKMYKIASPELNHFPLLNEIKSYNKPIILSSGVSKLSDIERALEITGSENNTLLHCITSYPAPEEDYNLRLIKSLKNIFGIETGVSDHSLDPVLVPVLSVLVGGTMVEKHITLSNNTKGLDDPVALNLENFKIMCDSIRFYENMDRDEGVSRLKSIYGEKRVETILGSGIKKLAKSEENNYGRTNRSLHATTFLSKGSILTNENSALLRTEKVLRVGIPPHLAEAFYGKKLKNDIPDGEGIRLEDLF